MTQVQRTIVRTGQTQKTRKGLTETVRSHSETALPGRKDHHLMKEARSAVQAVNALSHANHSNKIQEKKAVISNPAENAHLTGDHSEATRERDFQEDARRVTVRLKRSLLKDAHLATTEDQVAQVEEPRVTALMKRKASEATEDHLVTIAKGKEDHIATTESHLVTTAKGKEDHTAKTESRLVTTSRGKENHIAKTESQEDRLEGQHLTALTKESLSVRTTEGLVARTETGLRKSTLESLICVSVKKRRQHHRAIRSLSV